MIHKVTIWHGVNLIAEQREKAPLFVPRVGDIIRLYGNRFKVTSVELEYVDDRGALTEVLATVYTCAI